MGNRAARATSTVLLSARNRRGINAPHRSQSRLEVGNPLRVKGRRGYPLTDSRRLHGHFHANDAALRRWAARRRRSGAYRSQVRLQHSQRNTLRLHVTCDQLPESDRNIVLSEKADHPTFLPTRSSFLNVLCFPSSPRSGIRTLFSGSAIAYPIGCACRLCFFKIVSVASTTFGSTM